MGVTPEGTANHVNLNVQSYYFYDIKDTPVGRRKALRNKNNNLKG